MLNQIIYEKNVKKMREYQYIYHKDFIIYSQLLKDYGKQNIDALLKENSETKNVFAEIYQQINGERPILLFDVYDIDSLQYLCKNLRTSKAYGCDNKVYLYYKSFVNFSLFLATQDLSIFLDEKCLVFLFNEDEKSKYYFSGLNIKRDGGEKEKIKVDEIKKLIFSWPWAGYSGNFFFDTIIDYHPNILTVKEFGFSAFGILYREILSGRSVEEGINTLKMPKSQLQKKLVSSEFEVLFKNAMFLTETPIVPDKGKFFCELRAALSGKDKPTKLEWFKGLFLAYNYALGREFPQRIVPAIFLNMHPIEWPVVECKAEMLDLYDQFEDLKIISLLRNQLSELGSVMQAESHNIDGEYDYLQYIEIVLNRSALYIDKTDKWKEKRFVIRFEDLKLYPKETTKKMCQYLQIPWNESLLETTANGKKNNYVYGGTTTKGWDTKPVYNLHTTHMGLLDYYRIEILKAKYYEPWGYKARFYDGVNFSKEEIIKLFDLPFKCESFIISEKQKRINKSSHTRLREIISRIYDEPIPKQANGKEKIPVKWIKPDIDEACLYK